MNFDAEDAHARQLRRCLNDHSLPPEIRITGALVRLYALPLTKIVELTTDQLGHDASHAYLTIRSHPVLLPPKLARLISDYQRHHAPGQRTEHDPRYLLPGQRPGRPRNPAGLADAMRRYGLPARAARNTAMIQALADLPPPLIADLIGIDPATAERWSVLAAERWSEYVGNHSQSRRSSRTAVLNRGLDDGQPDLSSGGHDELQPSGGQRDYLV